MTIKDMHFDFKQKLNKRDSQQYRNMLIPNIDWTLNEAQELFVKMVAKPRLRSEIGFEMNQRTIDDIRNIVVDDFCIIAVGNVVTLPTDYWHFLSGEVIMSTATCTSVRGDFVPRQHDDKFEKSKFDNSNFEWRTVNGVFFENGVKLFTDSNFTISQLCISYLKKLTYIHNAEDFRGSQYTLPSGVVLSGSVDCELPDHTHREIVDIAVLIATGELQIPDYQIKMAKLNLNNLK